LRLIGDPATRFKEDPVRILRAIRFAAKLEFTLDEETEAQIQPHAELLRHIPAARLSDEFTKLFINGHALQTFAELEKHKLLHYLLPSCDLIAKDTVNANLIKQALINTDDRLRIGKTVTPTFILAVLLWPALRKTQKSLSSQNLSPMVEFHTAAQIIMNEQAAATTLPKLIQIGLKEIWDLQNRLENRTGRRAFKLLEHGKFRAAYDFLLLREHAGEIELGLGEWWTQFQQQNETDREESVRNLGSSPINKKKKPRKRKPKSSALNAIENN
jgi:poly(A) polymerase